MPNVPGQQLQEDMLSAIRKSQEVVIDAINKWAETVQAITPKIPSVQVHPRRLLRETVRDQQARPAGLSG